MPAYERRALGGSLLVALPGIIALVATLIYGRPDGVALWPELVAVALCTWWLAQWQYRRLIYPIHTLASLLEALREGDYSMRGAQRSVLGEVVYDINALADRLQSERLQFEESSYLLGKTLAALDNAVLVFDQDDRLRLLNPAAQRLLRAERHDLFGRTALELGVQSLLEAPSGQLLSHAFPGRSGRFEIRHAPLRRGGKGGHLLVVNDVGRVLREEERQAWQRLLRVLGHEVNNSLAPIQSMAETLATLVAREPMPADWREDFHSGLEVIGKRAGALGRFLAGYSRLARLPPPHKRDVDVAGLVEKVVRLEQRLPVQIEMGAPLIVQADPGPAGAGADQPAAQRRRGKPVQSWRGRRALAPRGRAGADRNPRRWPRSARQRQPVRAVLHHQARRLRHRPRPGAADRRSARRRRQPARPR